MAAVCRGGRRPLQISETKTLVIYSSTIIFGLIHSYKSVNIKNQPCKSSPHLHHGWIVATQKGCPKWQDIPLPLVRIFSAFQVPPLPLYCGRPLWMVPYFKSLPLTDFLFSSSLPMISTSSASKRDCCVHQSGSSENTRNLMLLCLLRKCSIASWRVFTCQVSMVLNHHRISVYANTAQSQVLHKNKRREYVGWLHWTKWVGGGRERKLERERGDGKNQLFVVSVSRR